MKINLETIQKLNPCQDRLDNYKNHYNTSDFTLEEFLNLDKTTYTDKVWVVTKLFTKKQNVLWSIKCAESVLHLFEREYPEDKRPRGAIEAARFWTIKQGEVALSATRSAESATRSAESAARSAESAARSATWSAARSAARSAESAAWSVALSATRSAAEFARSAAEFARSAANSASWSAMSASWSARSTESAESTGWFAKKQQEELNLKFMLESYNETKGE